MESLQSAQGTILLDEGLIRGSYDRDGNLNTQGLEYIAQRTIRFLGEHFDDFHYVCNDMTIFSEKTGRPTDHDMAQLGNNYWDLISLHFNTNLGYAGNKSGSDEIRQAIAISFRQKNQGFVAQYFGPRGFNIMAYDKDIVDRFIASRRDERIHMIHMLVDDAHIIRYDYR